MHASRECLLINTSIKILPQSLLMPKIWRIHFCLYYRTTQKPRWIISDERHRQTPNRCECLRPEGDQGIMTQHGNAVYCIDMYTLQPLPQDRRWIDAAVRMHFTLFGRKEEKRESRSPYFECRNSPSPLIECACDIVSTLTILDCLKQTMRHTYTDQVINCLWQRVGDYIIRIESQFIWSPCLDLFCLLY